MKDRNVSPHGFAIWYFAGAAIVVVLSVASALVLRAAIGVERRAVVLADDGASQRVLAQHVVSLAVQYAAGDADPEPGSKTGLAASLAAFRTAALQGEAERAALLQPDFFMTLAPDGPPSITAFMHDAASLLALTPATPAFTARLASLLARTGPELDASMARAAALDEVAVADELSFLGRAEAVILGLLALTVTGEALFVVGPFILRVTADTAQAMRLATIDPLTGLENRRGFLARAEIEQARARRYRRPLSLVTFDVDHFKQVNDNFGHAGGDAVLLALAKTFGAVVRDLDIVGRLGGEEFAVLLPETDVAGARHAAERVRLRVEAMKIKLPSQVIRVTVSAGVTDVPPEEGGLAQALQNADRLLYRAKRNGRNCVVARDAAEVLGQEE